VPFPDQFRPVLTYVMKNGKPEQVSVLDEGLWKSRAVVYARLYRGRPVYIGSTDKRLSSRIGSHIRHIHEWTGGKAAEYREWAEGKRITFVAYKPPQVTLLGRKCLVHRGIEVALIDEFKPEFVVRR
jgi:hypothetical protein